MQTQDVEAEYLFAMSSSVLVLGRAGDGEVFASEQEKTFVI